MVYIFNTFSCIMLNMNTNDKNVDLDNKRLLLIKHAKIVLNSKLTGVQIAKETGVNAQQVCLYRNGKRDIERRSEEHTSELQSRFDIVCSLLLEKKKKMSTDWKS